MNELILCSLLNRASGSSFFELFKNASLLPRVIATGIMAFCLFGATTVGLYWRWAALLLHRTLAGSSDVSAAGYGTLLDADGVQIPKWMLSVPLIGGYVVGFMMSKHYHTFINWTSLKWLTRWMPETHNWQRRIKGSMRQGIKHLWLIGVWFSNGCIGDVYLIALVPFIYWFLGYAYQFVLRHTGDRLNKDGYLLTCELAMGPIIGLVYGVKL